MENHPAVYDTFATAAEKITRPPYHTDLPDEQASAPLHSQQIAQEEELNPKYQANQHRNLSIVTRSQRTIKLSTILSPFMTSIFP